jgi:competence protein ComFC
MGQEFKKVIAGFNEYSFRLLNMVYPKRCIGCRVFLPYDNNRYACDTCWNTIRSIEGLSCRICSRPLPYGGERCFECKNETFPYEKIISAVHYDGIVREYLHRIKFNSRKYLIKLLMPFLNAVAEKNNIFQSTDALVPVPLHPSRLRERGFNQSEIFCTYLSKQYRIPMYKNMLRRVRNTAPQFELLKDKRKTNLMQAFSACKEEKNPPRNVILFDDICTTGFTFRECSLALKKIGVKHITCLCLARD